LGKELSRRKITPEELERRRKAVAAIERWRERMKDRLKGVTLTDILMEMRYGSGKWCD
jgi:predicted Zn-dependent peptidase